MTAFLLLLACATTASTSPAAPETPATPAVPVAAPEPLVGADAPGPGGFQDAPVADWYPDAGDRLAGCTVSGQTGMSIVLQLQCPGDRVLTDTRGVGVPGPDGAVDFAMRSLQGLGLDAAPRQAMATIPLPDGSSRDPVQAHVIDATAPDLQTTVWVVHAFGTMPQVLTCMALADDTDAASFCADALGAMLLPPGPTIPGKLLGRPPAE